MVCNVKNVCWTIWGKRKNSVRVVFVCLTWFNQNDQKDFWSNRFQEKDIVKDFFGLG